MNKNKILLAILMFGYASFAQKSEENTESTYNKWSIELNAGQNKAEKPFTPGYYSSNPDKYFNFSGVNHFDFGVRYMFNTTFGAKLDVGYDMIENDVNTSSLPFETNQFRIGLQGVINLGRLLEFESFSKRFSVLAHGGLHVTRRESKNVVDLNNFNGSADLTEDDGGIMLGLTPQFRISNRIVLTGDFSYISNVRQHLAWDGNFSDPSNNLSGTLLNTSLGLTFYLGKQEKHADWTYADDLAPKNVTDKEAQKRLDDIETLMNDTDKDGVPDYLDVQNNTPNGVSVDTKGRYIDSNNNDIPDELEPREGIDGKDGSLSSSNQDDIIKTLVEKGYVNIFFDINKDTPNSGSTNNVYFIISYLKQNPNVSLELSGYADYTGNEAANQELSSRRAQNIYDLFIGSGIDASRVSMIGKGVDNSFPDSTTGLSLSRRVSVTVK